MSVSQLFAGRASLQGTLTDSLTGQSVSQPGQDGLAIPPIPQVGAFQPIAPGPPQGLSPGAAGAPQFDFSLPAQPQVGTAAPPVGLGGGAEINRFRQELESGSAGTLATVLGVVGAPIRVLMDIIGQLDRPQQFLWAATIKGLEGGSFFEGLEAGTSAFFFRRPEPGGPKRRIEPDELINTVAREVFGVEKFGESLDAAPRFMLNFGVAAAVDPLMFVPGVWYARTGTKAKSLYHQIVAADRQRYAITGGTDVIHQAATVRDLVADRFLQETGKVEGPLGRVIMSVSQDATDDEIAAVRDIVTGFGVRGLDEELQLLFQNAASGVDVSPEMVEGAMARATDNLSEDATAQLSDQISRFIGARRGAPDRVELFGVKVGTKKKWVTFETGRGDELAQDMLIGQLMNRAGLDPSDALVRAGRVGRFLEAKVGERTGALAEVGIRVDQEGRLLTDPLSAWRGLPAAARQRLLMKRRGRNRQKVARTEFDNIAELEAAIEPAELVAVQQQFIDSAASQQTQVVLSRREFINEALADADTRLPKGAAKSYEQALRRSVGTGRFWVDAVSAARLRNMFAKYDLEDQAAENMALVAAGVKKPEVITDLPMAAANRETLRSMVDQGHQSTRDLHLLWLMLDPRQVVGDPIFARAKYGEDLYHAVQNSMGQEMDKLFVGLKEGGEESRRLGLAMYSDELEELVRTSKPGDLAQSTLDLATAAVDAREGLKASDSLWTTYVGAKGVLAGFRESFIRRGFQQFAEGGISNYMARVYPRFKQSVTEAVQQGLLSETEAKQMIRRSKRSIDAALGPLDLDFVQGNHVAFRHLKSRKFREPLPGLETDILKLMRAYTQGGLRKLYLEPMVQDINALSKNLPKGKKKYVNMWLRRMMGFEVGDEEALNNLGDVTMEMFGKVVQAGTLGAFKAETFTRPRSATRASLFVTRNFYRGLLGGSTSFMIKNFAQGVNTATKEGPWNFMRGMTMFVTNPMVDAEKGLRFRDLLRSRNLSNDLAQLMEKGVYQGGVGGGVKKLGVKMDEIIFAPAKFSEFFNRGVALGAGLNRRMKEAGADSVRDFFVNHSDEFAEAVQYGHSIANETQFIYGIVGRSPVAGSVTGRLGLQFFSWPVKQSEFLVRGTKDEGINFLLRYTAFSGLISHIAEQFEVDASTFTGFGFVPSQAAPAIQVLGHLNAAWYAAFVEDDKEGASDHFGRMLEQVENMIPAFLQVQKTLNALEQVQTGVQRESRGRFSRRTDDLDRQQGFSQILDQSTNRLNDMVGLPRVSGEQAARILGLPSKPANEFREAIRSVQKADQQEDRKYRKFLDRYIAAYHSGRFVESHEIKMEALREGVFLTPEIIKREVTTKMTPQVERIAEQIRGSSRVRAGAEVFSQNPELFRHMPGVIPLPPDALGGTR